ncbi:MAG: DUF4295 domain-containing protein [Bacteroidia bacterium]
MAKKVVATFKAKVKVNYTKVIRAVKTERGTYSFKEEIMQTENVKDFLKENGH